MAGRMVFLSPLSEIKELRLTQLQKKDLYISQKLFSYGKVYSSKKQRSILTVELYDT